MKKTFITTGGSPIISDYITILQDGTIEALAALVSSFGAYLILQGCVVTIVGTTHTITAGWVFFNGEIIRVPAHSWEATSVGILGGLPNSIAYTEIIETANPIPYADGSNHAMAKETRLKFKEFAAETSPVYFLSFKNLGKAIGDILQPVFTESVVAVSGSGFAFASGVSSSGGDALQVRKRIDKTLIISGFASGIDITAATISGVPNCKLILTLDAAYRPASKVFFTNVESLAGTYSNTPVIRQYVLFPDGKLCLIESTTVANPTANFQTAVVTLL